jgi:hypothetical protein
MYLRLIIRDAWTILAVCATEERCDVLDFAEQLRRDDPAESARLMRAFARMGACGPPRNTRRSRALAHDILELKTPGGVRVLYFFDESRVVVCSEAMMKPKQRGLQIAVERAARHRWRYLNDKRRGSLRILEER